MVFAFVVSAALLHATYITNGFVWLDHGDIEQGRALLALQQWLSAFTNSFASTGFYRPLVTLFHSLDALLWGINAPGFHCTNIVLHLCAAAAAPAFAGAFFPISAGEKCVIALIFGLHPVAILPCGCISYRSESLLALFTFLSVAQYGKTRTSPTPLRLLLFFLLCLCACFSKETAFFYLPCFFTLWEILRFARNRNAEPRKGYLTKGMTVTPGAAVAAIGIAYYLRSQAVSVQWCISSANMTTLESIGTRLVVAGRHLTNLFAPFPPALSDVVEKISITNPFAMCISGAIMVGAYFVFKRGIRSFPATLAVLVSVCLLPGLDLMPLPRFYSPHYGYCAIAPFAAGVVLLGRRISAFRPKIGSLYGRLVFLWILIMAVSTMVSGQRFKSDRTLFASEVKKDIRFSEAWFYLGNYFRLEGSLDSADDAYDQGLAPAPGCIRFFDPLEFLINKSSIAVRRNDLAAADSLMQIAQACSPEAMWPDLAYIRADIAARRGDFDAVISLLSSIKNEFLRPEARKLLDWAMSRADLRKQ